MCAQRKYSRISEPPAYIYAQILRYFTRHFERKQKQSGTSSNDAHLQYFRVAMFLYLAILTTALLHTTIDAAVRDGKVSREEVEAVKTQTRCRPEWSEFF